jgi:phosphoglycolate phosphatase-like HAD superfamily hydrolase
VADPPSEDRPLPQMVAVVDVDGVLADVRHRLHHVRARPKDWTAFFAAAGQDGLLEQGAETARRLAEVYEVVYLSGRPERLRALTESWFGAHDLPAGRLVLRPAGDHRPASVWKVEELRALARTRTVVVLVDDDDRVLDAARRAGFDVLPATWMGDAEALHEAQEDDGRT